MNNCPEQIELYSYVDGELERPRWQMIHNHLPRCSRCRDEIRSIARLNRELHRRDENELPHEFEDQFRAALMARMVTSTEAKTFRQILGTRRLVSLAAGILLAFVIWSFFPRSENRAVESPSVAPATTLAQVDERNAVRHSLSSFVSNAALANVEFDLSGLSSLHAMFRRHGLNLVSHIAARLLDSPDPEKRVLYRILGETKSSQARSLLVQDLTHKKLTRDMKLTVLDSIVRHPNSQSARVIRDQEKSGLSVADSLQLLSKLPDTYAWPEIEAICRERSRTSPSQVIKLLTGFDTPKADALLLELHMNGLQSHELLSYLGQRKEIVEESKRIVGSRSNSESERRRAIQILGEGKDVDSAGMLVSLAKEPKLRQDAFRALAQIGTEDAMLDVVHRLPTRLKDRRGRREEDKVALVEQAILAFGDAGLQFYLRQMTEGDPVRKTQYLQALGILGDEKILDFVYQMAEQAELKEAALVAVIRIGSVSSVPFLKRMARDRHFRIRQLAVRGLRKIETRIPRNHWRGFARISKTSESAAFQATCC